MISSHHRHFLEDPVEFVREKDKTPNVKDTSSSECQPSLLSGIKVKKIYESIINSPGNSGKSSKDSSTTTVNKKATKRKPSTSRDVKPTIKAASFKNKLQTGNNVPTVNSYLRAAESGNLPEVEKIVKSGMIDMDATDQYSWTALMIASHLGHQSIVEFLLCQGASWEDNVDGSAYDAYDLACLSGHYRIAEMLRNRKSVVKSVAIKRASEVARQKVKREKLWCEVCECHYSATIDGVESHNNHQSSVLHQFCYREKEMPQKTSNFFLDNASRGYELLRKEGWDGSSGLGPSGSGRKYPVKTILKRDRLGFGSNVKSLPRVTHFQPNDNAAVKTVKKLKPAKRKVINAARVEKEKNLERKFRRLFY